ncbi:unnamed protein product [Effrenium voratum]|nr:unnamed protein product [Effrenium voratum]|mmetsp:Transcript_117880/g.279733  ORF Transcript_117880/g.279733 Transcript_117880/m.279733 type:complete len:256 (+) Transcript_117880:72-839(+)
MQVLCRACALLVLGLLCEAQDAAPQSQEAKTDLDDLDLGDLDADDEDEGEEAGGAPAEDFDKDMPEEDRSLRMKVCLGGAMQRLHSNAEAVSKLASQLVEQQPGMSKDQATNSIFFTWMMTCYMNIPEETVKSGDADSLKDARLFEPNPAAAQSSQSASRKQWALLEDVLKEHMEKQQEMLKSRQAEGQKQKESSGQSQPPVQEPPAGGSKLYMLLALGFIFGIMGLGTMLLVQKEKQEKEEKEKKKDKKAKKKN